MASSVGEAEVVLVNVSGVLLWNIRVISRLGWTCLSALACRISWPRCSRIAGTRIIGLRGCSSSTLWRSCSGTRRGRATNQWAKNQWTKQEKSDSRAHTIGSIL